MSGWIKLHRKLRDHWLWRDPVKLSWWLDILMESNHEYKRVLLKGQLIECSRGQCVRSVREWASRWRTSRGSVERFFILIENEAMIRLENVQITSRLTVCNYGSYQDDRATDEATDEATDRATDGPLTGNDIRTKELKEERRRAALEKKKEEFKATLQPYLDKYGKDMLNAFWKYWMEPNKSGTKTRFDLEKTWDLERRLETWSSNSRNQFNPPKQTEKTEIPNASDLLALRHKKNGIQTSH